MAAILDAILIISNSLKMPEWHESDSQIVGHIVPKSAKKLLAYYNARFTAPAAAGLMSRKRAVEV